MKTETKKAKKEKCREILHKYNDLEFLNSEDKTFMLSIFENHPWFKLKSGSGIDQIFIKTNKPYLTRGFWIRRKNGTVTEISHGQDVYDITKKYDLIIANPWWSLKHSLRAFNFLQEHLTKKGILIFIINNVFCYQGSDRGESLDYQKYYFLPRWTFETSGRPLLDCGIMIYHKNGIVPKEAATLKPFIKLSRFPVKEFILKEGFDIITDDGERDIEVFDRKIKARSMEHALKKFL